MYKSSKSTIFQLAKTTLNERLISDPTKDTSVKFFWILLYRYCTNLIQKISSRFSKALRNCSQESQDFRWSFWGSSHVDITCAKRMTSSLVDRARPAHYMHLSRRLAASLARVAWFWLFLEEYSIKSWPFGLCERCPTPAAYPTARAITKPGRKGMSSAFQKMKKRERNGCSLSSGRTSHPRSIVR